MPELVALALPARLGFVDALRQVWDEGHAAFPIDLRLPRPARDQLLRAMAPARLIDPDGTHDLTGSRPVDDGDALVVATSGTTGEPKGVALTHEAVRASAMATSARLDVDPTSDRWLACLPLNHVGGLSVVTRALLTGVELDMHDGFDAKDVHAAARAGATLVSLVPTALRRIDASFFRRILVGGGAPPEWLASNVVVTYGMTETGSGVVYDGEPLDGVEVRVDGADDEVSVRGPMLLRSYRDGTDPKDGDGWLRTGDLGELGPDGRLRVLGRRDDLIKTGGERVWPSQVEAVLLLHPGVAEVVVAGRPDPEWGQRVVATVVPSDPEHPPTLDDLRSHTRDRLPAHAAPKELELVDEVPRTALGKARRTTP